MNKQIRLLIEGFFDDEIFNVENNIKSDIEDLARYYDYKVGDIYYNDKKPYAVCCGESKQFKDDKPRFCLLIDSGKQLKWCVKKKLVKELRYFKFKFKQFYLWSFNNFKYIDEDGYGNTQIIKNNYDLNEFPAFEYCIELRNNIYLPAIDELQIMYLNKDKLGKYSFRSCRFYWSSTQYSSVSAYYIYTNYGNVSSDLKGSSYYHVRPFFRLD